MLSDYKKSTHYVIDIETLGTKPGCPILQIGAVQVRDGEIEKSKLITVAFSYPYKEKFKKIDKKTICWWLYEHPETLSALISDSVYEGLPISQALIALIEFCDLNRSSAFFWSKHPCFDFPILEKAFKTCKYKKPWEFWQIREIATLEDKCFLKSEPQKNSHNALEDAKNEAMTLIQVIWPENEK